MQVLWDKTGTKGDYRTGYEGEFRLALAAVQRDKADNAESNEFIVGTGESSRSTGQLSVCVLVLCCVSMFQD